MSLVGRDLSKATAPVEFSEPAFEIFLAWIEQNALNEPCDSLISGRASFSPQLRLHLMAGGMLRRDQFDVRDCGRSAAVAISTLRRLVERWHCFHCDVNLQPHQLLGDLPPAVQDACMFGSVSLSFIPGCIGPTFATIQLFFTVCHDKSAFLRMVVQTFGLFDNLPFQTSVIVEMLVINFIASLLVDRAAIHRREELWVANHVLTRLKCGPMTWGAASRRSASATSNLWRF
jgi:hypothetical protein